MYKSLYGFLTAFFGLFFILIIYINYVGWSGGYINYGIGWDNTTDYWTNGYFGFESFLSMINDFKYSLETGEVFNWSTFIDVNSRLLAWNTRIPLMLEYIESHDWNDVGKNILQILTLIGTFFGSLLIVPCYSIGAILYDVVALVWYLMTFMFSVFNAFLGRYNIPMNVDRSDYYPSSLSEGIYSFSVLLKTPFVPLLGFKGLC